MERLLLDVMLGKLATYLRMCGYDAAYPLDREVEATEGGSHSDQTNEFHGDPRVADEKLLALSREEGRLLLTRDVLLARRAERSLLLTSLDVTDQLRELAEAGFELALTEPARCSSCNGELERVPCGEDTPENAPSTDETAVWRCRSCEQLFWKGSHWDDVAETLKGI